MRSRGRAECCRRAAGRRWRSLAALALVALPARGVAGPVEPLTGPSAADPLDVVVDHVQRSRRTSGLRADDLAEWIVRDRYVTRHTGTTHLYLRQRLHGIEVFDADLAAAVDRDGRLLSLHDSFVRDLATAVNAREPRLTPAEALARAARHLGLPPPSPRVLQEPGGPTREVRLHDGHISLDPIPVRLMYYPSGAGAVRLVWNLVLRVPDGQHWWSIHVDARSGRVLWQNDWIVRESYRAFALPLESPSEGPPTLETDPHDLLASPFGWHDTDGIAGAEFTDTQGNNSEVRDDLDGTDAGGAAPDGGPGLLFDFPPDTALDPSTYTDGSIVNLFYWTDLLHDILYRYGFDEAAGNFQQNNYGRGGVGSDRLIVDAQDGADLNNANMGVPPEGFQPRMQMFLWISTRLRLNSPPGLVGTHDAGRAQFGPALQPAGITRPVVEADAPDACTPLTNAAEVSGRIALIERGGCDFTVKVANAQSAGADGVIIANNVGNPRLITMAGVDPLITIPSVFVRRSLGNQIRDALVEGVSASLFGYARDSGLDSGVVTHEFAHGVSSRLTGGPSNANCLSAIQSGGMGEGWSDWYALALTAKVGDIGSQPRGIATYLVGQSPLGGGIRTLRYTTNMAVNPLTYGDVAIRFTVHSIGEVWAVTLWKLFWNLVHVYGFDPDLISGSGGNNLALQLVTDGMKHQPCNPSFLDARDGILQADLDANQSRNRCRIWDAFARRGMGLSADDGGSAASQSVAESFDLPATCALCGDVNDDEGVDLLDLAVEARALAFLQPMVAPEKCNVIGQTNPADPDADGVPNDCNATDLATLRAELAGIAPGISPVCEPAAGFGP